MPTLNDVKSAFYDAQRMAANAFEVAFADLKSVHDQMEAQAKEQSESERLSQQDGKAKT